MDAKPRVFIGSSREQLPIVQALLTTFANDDLTLVPWTDGVFRLMESGLESLLAEVRRCDFAVLVFGADDHIESREHRVASVRDNVVFELGLFLGHLGRERCFVLQAHDDQLYIPSDLRGITFAEYDAKALERDAVSALSPARRLILDHIREVLECQRQGSLATLIEGYWIEIKTDYDGPRPYALVHFESNEQDVIVRGEAFDSAGTRRLSWPDGQIDFSVVRDNQVSHAFFTQIEADGSVSRSYGLTNFVFHIIEGRCVGGEGYYAVYGEGPSFMSNRVRFALRRATPEYVHFLTGVPDLDSLEARGRFVRAFDRQWNTRRIVLTGGTYSGKTDLVQYFGRHGHGTLQESAILVIEEWLHHLGSHEAFAKWRNEHLTEFQQKVFERQLILEQQPRRVGERVFMDRSGVDVVAYLLLEGHSPTAHMETYARESHFDAVFVLDTITPFEPRHESGRKSTFGDSVRTRDKLIEVYRQFGHDPIWVPVLPIEQRAQFILDRLGDLSRIAARGPVL